MESLVTATSQVLLISSALVLMGIMAWSDARHFLLPLVPNIIFLVAGLIVGHLAFGISKSSALIGAGVGYLGLSLSLRPIEICAAVKAWAVGIPFCWAGSVLG